MKSGLMTIVLALSFYSSGLQERVTYSKDIEPIFQEKCIACHNHTVRQGGLNLESFQSLMNGGKSGPAIVSGASGDSRLIKMIEGTIKPQMPIGDRLTAGEIKAIKAWIEAGAAGPVNAGVMPSKIEPAAEAKTKIPDVKPSKAVNSSISSLSFHPDGATIAAGRYREVEIIDAKKNLKLAALPGHSGQVRSAVFSPDGKLLAAAGGSPGQFGEIKIWDVQAGKEIRSIRGHRDNIFAVAFSPDGSKLASCSYDKMVKIWDVGTGGEIANLKDHTDAVFSLAFSPDGKLLASASGDRTVKIWDVASGRRLYTLSDALDALNSLAFHPSGRFLAAAGADRIIRIWEINETEGKQIKSLIAHEDAINQVVFSPDGKILATASADRIIKLWDSASLTEIHATEIQPDWIFSMAFSPDGKRLAVGRYDGSIAFYDPPSGKAK